MRPATSRVRINPMATRVLYSIFFYSIRRLTDSSLLLCSPPFLFLVDSLSLPLTHVAPNPRVLKRTSAKLKHFLRSTFSAHFFFMIYSDCRQIICTYAVHHIHNCRWHECTNVSVVRERMRAFAWLCVLRALRAERSFHLFMIAHLISFRVFDVSFCRIKSFTLLHAILEIYCFTRHNIPNMRE